jgi:hypothetical protein
MRSDEIDTDPLVRALASLRIRDVHQRRADRLRRRCQAVLESPSRRPAPLGMLRHVSFRRVIGPAVAGLWCIVYLAEIIRRAAEVYGF